jgi:hypothetical protein
MAEQEVPAEPREVLQARRERAVAALSKAIRQTALEREQRARRWKRLGAFGIAAAVALGVIGAERAMDRTVAPTEVVATVGVLESVRGTLVVTHSGRARVVGAGETPKLVAGDELRTATDGSARLKTERSAVDIASSTQLTVLAPSSAEERIRLAVGRVALQVSKQAKIPRSVVVETPNAEVVVRGTVFSVAVDQAGGQPRTRVGVTEGSVWVLSGGTREIVSTGEEWSSSGAQKAAVPEVQPEPAPVVVAPEQPAQAVKVSPRVSSKSGGPGKLAEENKMFQAAVDARNRGDDRRAVELFGSLLLRHPKSRLAEEARVERMRALRRLGESARASAEARRYLSEHGVGFARDEARETALGGK